MRLSESEQQAIRLGVFQQDSEARLYLFGSRVDDTKRGGDIDLLILSDKLTHRSKETIRTAICKQIGWQKIDIVIAKDDSTPFVKLALKSGVAL